METQVKEVYAEFDAKRKHADALAADEEELRLLDDLEKQVKKKAPLTPPKGRSTNSTSRGETEE